MDFEKRIPQLDLFIEEKLSFLKAKADEIKEDKRSWDSINELFFKLVSNNR